MKELFKKNIIKKQTENQLLRSATEANPAYTNPERYAGPSIQQRLIGSRLEIGGGDKSFYATEEGIWLGAKRFSDAPFSVTMGGEAIIGSITLPIGGYIRSGQENYDTGTGFYLGNIDGTTKMSLGNQAGNKLLWDGSDLEITGSITGSSITGSTITGGTIQTDTGETDKIVISGNQLVLYQYDEIEFARERVIIADGGIGFLTPLGVASGSIFGVGTNQIGMDVGSGLIDYTFSQSSFIPGNDNTTSLGLAPNNRWSDVRSVLINGGDYGFENDWWITESYKIGIEEDGLAFLNEKHELVLFLGETGIYVKDGQVKNLNKIKYIIRDEKERQKFKNNKLK